jgi:AcrR family transcriptional regulator
MASELRERRKRERRDAILRAAERTIAAKGFDRATMEEIAENARVGVATVYKYFGTKAAIVEAIIRPTLDVAMSEADRIIRKPPTDPGLAMAELVDKYRLLRNDWSDRKLLLALNSPGTEKHNALAAFVRDTERRCQQQIRDLLLVLKGRGDINPTLNIDDAAFVVFCVFNQHFELFVAHEDIRAGSLFRDLARRIKMLFQNWSINDSK